MFERAALPCDAHAAILLHLVPSYLADRSEVFRCTRMVLMELSKVPLSLMLWL